MNVENEMPNRDSMASNLVVAEEESRLGNQYNPMSRRGDISKCPICGSSVDPEAYHCAKCRNYFCFHCRVRLLPPDTQVECINPSCNYYGKLICGICDPPHDKEEKPLVYAEPIDGYWPFWLLVSLVLGAMIWYLTAWWIGILAIVLLYGLGGYQLQKAGFNIFGKERLITQPRSSAYRTCLQCNQLVKEIQVER